MLLTFSNLNLERWQISESYDSYKNKEIFKDYAV